MRKILLAAAFSVLTATAAQAAGAPKASGDKGGQYVDISQVAVPILADGRLVNYVFLQVRLNLSASADAIKMREKEPFLRDALVRAVHRNSLAAKTNYVEVDEALVRGLVMREVSPLLGARSVSSVEIIKQNPKQRTGLPLPKA